MGPGDACPPPLSEEEEKEEEDEEEEAGFQPFPQKLEPEVWALSTQGRQDSRTAVMRRRLPGPAFPGLGGGGDKSLCHLPRRAPVTFWLGRARAASVRQGVCASPASAGGKRAQ